MTISLLDWDPATALADAPPLAAVRKTTLALEDWQEEREPVKAIDAIERAFLGTCLLCPTWLDHGALLSPSDFRSDVRGQVFDTMRDFPRRRFDLDLVALELERREAPLPRGAAGWDGALYQLLDDVVYDEALMPLYARAIKEAAALRRLARRADGSPRARGRDGQ